MAADGVDKELEDRLREVGNRLGSPPEGVDELLSVLDQMETLLSRVEQSPSRSMSNALRPAMSALVRKEHLGHADTDVKVAVASCISEITRITAPEAPYDDDLMKDVFERIVETFEKLDDVDSQSYSRRVSILETVAKVRSCVVMLDLECDDLILNMFHHFFKTVNVKHQGNVIPSMETIMTLVIEESEDISLQLASCLLQNVKKNEKETTTPSFRLAEKVIGNCPGKLKPTFVQLLQGTPLNEYSKVVTSVCQGNADTAADNDVNAPGKDTADDGKLSERTLSDELHQESAKLEQDASCPEEECTSPKIAPTMISNGATQVDNGEALAGPASPKQKPERSCRDEGKSTDQSKSADNDVAETVSSKREKFSDLNSKKAHRANSSVKAETSDRPKIDTDKEAPAESKKLSADTKEGICEPSKDDNGAANVMSEPVESTPDTVKPKRGRPPGPKSSDKKSVAKNQSSGLDSKKGSEEVSDSEGKSAKQSAKEDAKSSKKTGEGESSRKQVKASLKQKNETLPDEDAAEVSDSEGKSAKQSAKEDAKTSKKTGEGESTSKKTGEGESSRKQAKPSLKQKSETFPDEAAEVSDSEGKSKKRPAKEDAKSSSKKAGEGESSRKQAKASLKQQKGETLPDEDTAEDLSLKEMVSPKSFSKVSARSKGQLGESGGSKRKRVQETEEISGSKKSRRLDESLIGSRVKVWWPDDKMFYKGVVYSYLPTSKKHKIAYDDGDEEILLLKNEKWEFIEEQGQETDPDVVSELTTSKKSKGTLGRPPKEGKTETPKSGKELHGSDGGDPPKRKGRPKGVRSSSSISNDESPKLKGKAVSKDLEETPKTSTSLKKEGANRSKENTSRSSGKAKDDLSKPIGHSKDDSPKSGRKLKDSSSKTAGKSKDEVGSKGKDSKDTTKSGEVTPKVGRKLKSTTTPKMGEGSKTNGLSDKGKVKEKEGGASEKEELGSGKTSTGKKRRRKAQS